MERHVEKETCLEIKNSIGRNIFILDFRITVGLGIPVEGRSSESEQRESITCMP